MTRYMLSTAMILGLAAPAAADAYVYGSWLGTTNRTNAEALVPCFDLVRDATNGEVDWQMVAGSQLGSGAGTPEAVGSGFMDADLVMSPYQPRMLPATNLIFSQSLVGEIVLASVGVMNQTLMLDCDACHAEYEDNGAVGFAGYGVSPYFFLCRGDPRTIDDPAKLKIRGSGGGAHIIELLDGSPFSMTGNEFTAAMERGTVDCILGSVQWLHSFRLMDITDTVIDAPMGMGGPPVTMYVNREAWQGMTPEQRQAHIELSPDLVTMTAYDVQFSADESAIEDAKERGITFIEDGPEYDEGTARRDDLQYDMNVANAQGAGVETAPQILDAYLANFARWSELLDAQGRDRETFPRLLWDEVHSKVDPDTL